MRKLVRFSLWTGLVLAAIGVLLRLFFFQVWTIPSDDKLMSASIAPSLAGGDFVVLLHAGRPSFGDLVRCADPEAPTRHIIGRIAAESSDTLVVTDASLIVNGKQSSTEVACSPARVVVEDPTSGDQVELRCEVEDLAGVKHKRATKAADTHPRSEEQTIKTGFVYLVSDNRAYPDDSRLYGAVPLSSCDARIVFRLWSALGFSDIENRFTWIQ